MPKPPNGEAEIRGIVASAEEAKLDEAAEITRLAGLHLLQYEREREDAAERLGCRVSILDRLVGAQRPDDGAASRQGRSLELPKPEPWPEPVPGDELLDALVKVIQSHVVLSSTEADAAALWVVGCHAFDAWAIFPRLIVTSPERGCGKTTLLDVLSRLVPRRLGASNITAAALFRTIEVATPTLLLDEADSYARNNEDLRGVLDAGHRRDGTVIRTAGDDHEPRQFSVWAPVVLAAIGRLPATIEDRSVVVRLRRRRPDEEIEPLRLDRVGGLEKLACKAARWAIDRVDDLKVRDPEMPEGLINRKADNWRPLLAVADTAGGDWPERARRAAVDLSRDGTDIESKGVLLLADLRELFDREGDRTTVGGNLFDRDVGKVLFTEEIIAELANREDRPWPEWKGGKPINARQLASLLKPFGISPNTVRRGEKTAKGYSRQSFEDAFARYLLTESVTASQPPNSCGFEPEFKASQRNGRDVSEYPRDPSDSAACDVVTGEGNRATGAVPAASNRGTTVSGDRTSYRGPRARRFVYRTPIPS
jgi:putative DNA primase/helicase